MRNEDLKKKEFFYKEFRQTSGSLLLGLIIISFGTVIIPWFYERCKDFQLVEKHAPEPQRAAAILGLLPLGWTIIGFIISKLIITNVIGEIVHICGWGFILFLILKFLYDFCEVFGLITGTRGFYWFLLLSFGLIGIIGAINQIVYLMPLLIFVLFIVPAMQLELNSHFQRMTIRKDSNVFYK